MKTINLILVVMFLAGASAFSSEAFASEDMSGSKASVTAVQKKKKISPEERMKQKIHARVDAVADSLGLSETEKEFLCDKWLNAEKERAAIQREGKTQEELKAERGAINRKYDAMLKEYFGKERLREINAASKAYLKSLRASR